MSRHKNRVNFDPDTKNKSFSSRTLKSKVSSDPYTEITSIDHLHNNQNHFHTYTETKSSSTLKSSQFRPHTQTPSQFRFSHYNHSGPEIKSISKTHTKTKSISITLQPSDFRPHTKTKAISTTHTKNRSIGPHTK